LITFGGKILESGVSYSWEEIEKWVEIRFVLGGLAEANFF